MNRRTAVITDGNERSALAIVRSLGTAGYRCIVVSSNPRSLAGESRFTARSYVTASPLAAPSEFAASVEQIVREERAALLIPVSEASLLALLPRRGHLGECVIPFADESAFRAISDKQRVLSEAASLGIAVPAQVVADHPAAVAGPSVEALTYPLVIKPARSVGETHGTREKFGVAYAENPAELRRAVGALSAAAFPVLLQQRIVGPGTGAFLLVWDGTVRASFAHQRLTEKPPEGGVSVDRESVPLDARLLELSRALLARFAWQGVAMIEYKIDQVTGTPYLMEINGRFWGSLQLAIDAGIDFPALLAAYALHDPVTPPSAYRVGVRSHWFWGQIDHLISRRPRRTRRPPLPTGTVSVWRVACDILLAPLRRATSEEVFRWNDPKPFLFETRRWLGR